MIKALFALVILFSTPLFIFFVVPTKQIHQISSSNGPHPFNIEKRQPIFVSPDQDFKVAFPYQPGEINRYFNSKFGNIQMKYYFYYLQEQVFGVMVWHVNQVLSQDQIRSSFDDYSRTMYRSGFQVIKEGKITIQGHPGYAGIVEKDGKYFCIVFLYRDRKLYEISASFSQETDKQAFDFINSFQFI